MFDDISINGSGLETRLYDKIINSHNTGIMTVKKYGSSIDNQFQFGYDDKFRLLTKKNNQTDMVTLVYNDEFKSVNLTDHLNQITKEIIYNSEREINKETITDSSQVRSEYHYSHDNLGGLQKRVYLQEGHEDINISKYNYAVNKAYDFDHSYEYQEYNLEGYLDRISTAYLNDYVRPNESGKSLYSYKTQLKLFSHVYESQLNQSIMRFDDKEGCLVFDKNQTNSKRSDKKIYGNHTFNLLTWKSNFLTNKIIYSWFRLSGQIIEQKEIMRLGDLSLYIDTDMKLTLLYDNTHIKTDLSVFLDEWSLVGLRINQTDATVFLGDEYSTHVIPYHAIYVNFLSIGNYPLSNANQNYLDTKVYETANCLMDVLYVGYGTNITEDVFGKIYKDGKMYLDLLPKYQKEQVSYYNHSIHQDAEVVSLNGSLISSKGLNPKSYQYTDRNYKSNKLKLFEYDHKLQRHVYGSYRNYVNYDVTKKSKLSYDFSIKNSGSVIVFVKPSSSDKYTRRTILGFVNGLTSALDLFIDDKHELKVDSNGSLYSSGLKLLMDEWNMVTFLWQSNQLQVSVNNSSLITIAISPDSLSNTTLFVGSSAENDVPIDHFEGDLQMLSLWTTNITNQTIDDIYNDGLPLNVRTEFDHNGRMKSKTILSKDNVLTKKYQYFEENGELNSLPTS